MDADRGRFCRPRVERERWMKLRRAMATRTDVDGPIARLVRFLSLHGFTAFDGLMCPFHALFAVIMLATPKANIQASPVYRELLDIAPIEVWALTLALLAAMIVAAITWQRWWLARLAYVLIAAWWFAISGLVYVAATTLLSPLVYVLIGIVCLYRQAEIAVGYERGGD